MVLLLYITPLKVGLALADLRLKCHFVSFALFGERHHLVTTPDGLWCEIQKMYSCKDQQAPLQQMNKRVQS